MEEHCQGSRLKKRIDNYNCTNDDNRSIISYLLVSYFYFFGWLILEKSCGTTKPGRIVSYTGKATLRFKTDFSVTKKGFRVEITDGATESNRKKNLDKISKKAIKKTFKNKFPPILKDNQTILDMDIDFRKFRVSDSSIDDSLPAVVLTPSKNDPELKSDPKKVLDMAPTENKGGQTFLIKRLKPNILIHRILCIYRST